MDPFWNTWRSRRNFNYFFVSLVGFVAFFIIGTIIHQTGLEQYLVPTLPGFGLVFVVWAVHSIRRARARRRERLQRSPMSRDELRVARSKLMQYRKAKGL